MSKGGWIKLHRSMLDNPTIIQDSDCFSIWVFLLLKAAHKDGVKVTYSGTQYTLNAGQVITSRQELGEQLKINASKVQRVLTKLQNEQMIEQQTSNRNRVISICNWDKYQFSEHQSEQQNEQEVNNWRTTDEQQTEQPTLYNKKYKNDKNDNNNNAHARVKHAIGVSINNQNDEFTPVMDSEAKEKLDKVREDIRKRHAAAMLELEREGD